MSARRTRRRTRQIAARRVFQTVSRPPKRVVLTIFVPEPVPGSDWGCRIQIRGVGGALERPREIYGIDALQAMQLAIQTAQVALEHCGHPLAWLGEKGDLGFPPCIPSMPPPYRARVDAVVDREWRRYAAAAQRRAQTSRKRQLGLRKKA